MYFQNNRQDLRTVAEIHVATYSPTSTVTSSFVDLLSRMEENNHITGGPEVFSVARYIRSHIPNYTTSQPWLMLPSLTRLIIPGAFSGSYTNFQMYLENTPTAPSVPMTGIIGITQPRPIYAYNVKALTSFGYAIFITAGTAGTHWRIVSNRLDTSPALGDATSFDLSFPNGTTDYVYLKSGSSVLQYFTDLEGNYKFCTNCGSNATARIFFDYHNVHLWQMYNPSNQREVPEIAHVIYKYANNTPNLLPYFVDLVNRMGQYGHFRGKEVFTLGSFIKDLLGDNNPSFAALPLTVQLVLGSNLTWTFVQDGMEYPMKYYWASDLHDNIQRYQFQWRPSSGTSIPRVVFDLMYGDGVGQLQQLFVNPNGELTQRLYSGIALYEFELELGADLDSFTINWDREKVPIVTVDEEPDFYFAVYTEPTAEPTTEGPTTEEPTNPTTGVPTEPPTDAPTEPPTDAPTKPPTDSPTKPPTDTPTGEPITGTSTQRSTSNTPTTEGTTPPTTIEPTISAVFKVYEYD